VWLNVLFSCWQFSYLKHHATGDTFITAGTLVPSSVNGDIAIQWEWSNFDPSQNSNPLTDYGKTLHNWLRPQNEHVTQNLCQSTVRECLATWNIRPLFLFLFFLYIFPDSPTEVNHAWIFTHNGLKHALWRKEVPFWGPHDDRQHYGVQISPKLSKMAFCRRISAAANGCKMNDVIEDWLHWRSLAAQSMGSLWLVERRILFIAYWESPTVESPQGTTV